MWFGPTSETAWMQKRQKNRLKYINFTELKKITSRIYSNCSNYSPLFLSPSNFVAVRFVSLKIFPVNYTSAANYFTFKVVLQFSKEKK